MSNTKNGPQYPNKRMTPADFTRKSQKLLERWGDYDLESYEDFDTFIKRKGLSWKWSQYKKELKKEEERGWLDFLNPKGK